MRVIVVIITAIIVCAAAGMGYVVGTRLGPRSGTAAFQAMTPVSAAPLETVAQATLIGTATATPTSTATPVLATATLVPRATLPPVFTPTSIPRVAPPVRVPPSATPRPPTATTQPTDTRIPSFTPTATATRTPTATPTPAYDFVVVELKEIPQPGYRDTAYIRGRLIDQKGNLVPGAYFQIASDGTPQFVAVEPHGDTPADGTATFAVTKGRFAVRVLGGRSEYAGWMVTGQTGVGTMSDWEFAFQTTRPVAANILVSPTPTPTATPGPGS